MSTPRVGGLLLTATIVELTLATAIIHASLGGLLFTLNAAGHLVLAAAIVVSATLPHRLVRRFAWAPRLALAGFAAATIAGYLAIGPYFMLGWATKAIETAIVLIVVADLVRVHGTAGAIVRAIGGSFKRSGRETMPVR